MLLGTLGANLLGILLTGEGTIRAGERAIVKSWGRDTIRTVENF